MGSAFLQPEELPSDLREFYNFDFQVVEKTTADRHRVVCITRMCRQCGSKKRVPVTVIRQSVKAGKLTGMCRVCSQKASHPQAKGEQAHRWKGGKRTTPDGYVWLRKPDHPSAQNGYIQEHRFVMEQMIGRYLIAGETVHHKNGIKHDNRPENLELWSSNHGDGNRYEDLSDEQIHQLIAYLEQLLQARQRP